MMSLDTISIAHEPRPGFDYVVLPTAVAAEAQALADRFRAWGRRTVTEAIEIGRELLVVGTTLGCTARPRPVPRRMRRC